jgi:GST-like protein
MIKFYYHPSPNPEKIALFLEEAGLAYELVPVDTLKGEQFRPEFLKINPNAKVPALTDGDAVLFDSTAILLYLAEKTGKFLPPTSDAAQGEFYSWLMFIATGIAPYSGQHVHFRHFAPEPKDYAVQRYTYEAERHWRILDERLATRQYLVGSTYTIVDMSLWAWAARLPFIIGQDCWEKFPNVKKFFDSINARPAAKRALALKERHAFKTDFDEEARRNAFPQNYQR